MKMSEIRSLTDKEIHAKIRGLKEEYFNLQLQRSTGQVEKPSRFRQIRKTIARLKTALSERRRSLQLNSPVTTPNKS